MWSNSALKKSLISQNKALTRQLGLNLDSESMFRKVQKKKNMKPSHTKVSLVLICLLVRLCDIDSVEKHILQTVTLKVTLKKVLWKRKQSWLYVFSCPISPVWTKNNNYLFERGPLGPNPKINKQTKIVFITFNVLKIFEWNRD
jgi:hypothetical protein